MISGAGIVTIEKTHSTLYGVRRGTPFFLNPRSQSSQCSVADGRPYELFSSRVPRDTVQSASDLTFVLQHRYLSLKKEGGVQEWRPRDFSASRDGQVSKRWPVSDIAEAADASEETQGEQLRTLSSIEDNTIVDDGLLSEEGQFSRGSKLDLVVGVQDVTRQAQTLKEDLMSLDYTVSPTPFTPEAVQFVAICVLLLFVFWLGNYYVPDLIFKNTVFRKEPEDSLDPTGTTSVDKNLIAHTQESQTGSSEANKTSKGDGGSSAINSGAGFTQNRKQNRPKSSKRK